MKTSQGKLTALAFFLLMIGLLFVPMRSGQKDSLVLSPSKIRMSPGGSYQLKCYLSSDNEKQTIQYSTSDAAVVEIERDGTVRALSAGNAIVSVTASDGASAHCNVEVTGVPLNELELNVSELHITKGQHSGLSVQYNIDASDTRLQWTSSDPSVATVDMNGRIEGIKGGKTIVTVQTPNGKTASCTVWVDVASTKVNITPYDMIVGVGAEIALNVTYLPEDATDSVQSWVVSNPKVLTIDENGVMKALAEGTVHVNVLTKNGLTAGMEVMVESAPKDLELNPSRATIVRGDTLDMQLLFMNRSGSMNSTTHPVVWTSSDASVAKIDENGRATGVGSGVTRITASCDGRTVSGYLTVRVYVHEIRLAETETYLLKEQTGKPIQLKLSTMPKDADNSLISFTSNNTQVANVDENGLITLTGGYGTAVITASAEGGASAEYTVHVVTELPRPAETAVPASTDEPVRLETLTEEPEDLFDEVWDADSISDEGFSDVDSDDDQRQESDDGYLLDEYGEIIYDEYGEPVYA